MFVKRNPKQAVNVARFRTGGRYALLPILSTNAVSGPGRRTEPTSVMCKRVRCLAAVNGDFFARGAPVGGLVRNAELVRTPIPQREQATVLDDGRLSLGPLMIGVRVTSTYPIVSSIFGLDPFERATNRSFDVNGVNVARDAGEIVLYTPSYGPRTETTPNGAEVVLRTSGESRPFQTGEDTTFETVALHQGAGNSAIPRDGAVLSGHGEGARALVLWWRDIQAGKAQAESILSITSTPGALQSISGNPVLLRDGRRAYPNNSFAKKRAPRTVLAWSKSGWVYLITFDGRQAKWATGVTLGEAASFVASLGATDAMNLDGGGSTTFVMTGRVVNRPSDRMVKRGSKTLVVHSPGRGDRVVRSVERPVADALAIVAR